MKFVIQLAMIRITVVFFADALPYSVDYKDWRLEYVGANELTKNIKLGSLFSYMIYWYLVVHLLNFCTLS